MSPRALGGPPIEHDDPTSLGLSPGDDVRWGTRSRDYGVVRYLERDGSVAVGTDRGLRSIRPSDLQVQRRGPRGGLVWQKVANNDASDTAIVPADQARRKGKTMRRFLLTLTACAVCASACGSTVRATRSETAPTTAARAASPSTTTTSASSAANGAAYTAFLGAVKGLHLGAAAATETEAAAVMDLACRAYSSGETPFDVIAYIYEQDKRRHVLISHDDGLQVDALLQLAADYQCTSYASKVDSYMNGLNSPVYDYLLVHE